MVGRVLIGANVLRVSRPGVDVTEATPQSGLIFDPITNRYNGSLHAGTVLHTDMTATAVSGGYNFSKYVPFGVTYAEVPRVIWGVWSPYYQSGQAFLESYTERANNSGYSWQHYSSTDLSISRTGITCTTTYRYSSSPYSPAPEYRWNYRYVVFII